MMSRITALVALLLLLMACQAKEEGTTSSGNIIQRDISSPQFTVSLPQDGWKKLGEVLKIILVFPYEVTVSGSPYINSVIGISNRPFYYESGSGTNTLHFSYSVTATDVDDNGITFSNLMELNGGSLTYIDSQNRQRAPRELNIPHSMIKVSGSTPFLSTVTPPETGVYQTGQFLHYTLTFSEPVLVTGTPQFSANLDSGNVMVDYVSGAGTNKLKFRRKILPGEVDADGFSTGNSLNLNPASGTNITDLAGNYLSSIFPITASPTVQINMTGPLISNVVAPASGTYTISQNMDFIVNMDQPVIVTGTPSLTLNFMTGNVKASYISGSGTSALVFRHTVKSGEADFDGITVFPSISLHGGTIKDLTNTYHSGLSFTPPDTTAILVDAMPGPSVFSVGLPQNGLYMEGNNLDFKLNFNREIIVTGTPRLPLIIGTSTVYAEYDPILSTDSSSMVFRYTLLVGDDDADGITLTSSIVLNGGTIRDINARDANLLFSPPNSSGILVDAITPTIISQSVPANGGYVIGQYLNFQMVFNENVIIAGGTPRIAVTLASGTVHATYVSGSGSNTLSFRYLIQSGDFTTAGITPTSPIDLNGATIRDAVGHNAILTFDGSPIPGVTVDALPPTIDSITGPAPGDYGIGQNLDFTVNWSEDVAFTGAPKIALTLDSGTVEAVYISSTGTSSIFRYTVIEGHQSNGITIANAITASTFAIKDMAGNPADLSFPLPLLDLSTINIDGVRAAFVSFTKPANRYYREGENLDFIINWSKDVNVTGLPLLKLTIGNKAVGAFYQSGSSTATSTVFRYTVTNGDLDRDGITMLPAISVNPPAESIKDSFGNDAKLGITLPSLAGILIDAIIPISNSTVPPPDDTYARNETMYIKIFWLEDMVVTGIPRIALTLDSGTVYAAYDSFLSTARMLVFKRTVTSTDNSTGIVMNTSIDLNGGTIQDVAENNANLTIRPPHTLPAVLVNGTSPVITSISGPANGWYKEGEAMDFTVTWSEEVVVTGFPTLRVNIGSNIRTATYVSGSGTPDTIFRYVVISGEEAKNGVSVHAPTLIIWPTPSFIGYINLEGGTIQDKVGNNAILSYSSQSFPNVKVDSIPPTIDSVTSTNILFKPISRFVSGTYVYYNVIFKENVFIGNVNHHIAINIGGTSRTALFYSHADKVVRYRYLVVDTDLALEGVSVTPEIVGIPGSIQDEAGNDAIMSFSFTEVDYVHYKNILARYNFKNGNYEITGSGSSSVMKVTDLSGKNRHINQSSSPAPYRISSGYGNNSTPYVRFNNSSGTSGRWLNLPNLPRLKYYAVVLRAPPSGGGFHPFLLQHDASPGNYFSALAFSFGANVHHFQTPHRFIQNQEPEQSFYDTTHMSPSWVAGGNYIYVFTLQNQQDFFNGILGSGSFLYGQIAEVIFFDDSYSLTNFRKEKIRNQLNNIHGAY
jgi:large repetitive protein